MMAGVRLSQSVKFVTHNMCGQITRQMTKVKHTSAQQATPLVWKPHKNNPNTEKLINGHVSSVLSRGRYYEGDFLNGVPHGKGRMLHRVDKRFKHLHSNVVKSVLKNNSNKYYEGEFQNGKYHGIGKLIYPNEQTLTGEFKLGRIHNGEGVTILVDNSVYEGQYKDGMKHGRGVVVYADGRKVSGEFRNDAIFTGSGVFVVDKNRIESGEWKNGHFKGVVHDTSGNIIGSRTFTENGSVVSSVFPHGEVVTGDLTWSQLCNYGKIEYPDGRCEEGMFHEHRLMGRGKVTFPGGQVLQGEFRSGHIYNGKGTKVTPHGRSKSGVWVKGILQP